MAGAADGKVTDAKVLLLRDVYRRLFDALADLSAILQEYDRAAGLPPYLLDDCTTTTWVNDAGGGASNKGAL